MVKIFIRRVNPYTINLKSIRTLTYTLAAVSEVLCLHARSIHTLQNGNAEKEVNN